MRSRFVSAVILAIILAVPTVAAPRERNVPRDSARERIVKVVKRLLQSLADIPVPPKP